MRSSTRLKQKYNPNSDQPEPVADRRLGKVKRHLSTELITTQTSDHSTSTTDDLPSSEYKCLHSSPAPKQYTTGTCQTTDDIVEIFHQSVQTHRLPKSDKSTYTDFIDQPLCENSTQTILKEEQETQTTDLNCPNDSQVYLYDMKSSQTQCDRVSDSGSPSPSSRSSPTHLFEQQQRLSSPYVDFSLTNSNHDRLQLFQNLIHTEEHPNGGASLIRTYYNEFLHLSDENASLFVNYFFNHVYGEVNQRARYSIGVLHDGARYLPDLVDYFSLSYPKMIVKTSNLINSKEVLTTTMGEYRNRLVQTYSSGTFRYGPLMSISLVGKVTGKEECGKRTSAVGQSAPGIVPCRRLLSGVHRQARREPVSPVCHALGAALVHSDEVSDRLERRAYSVGPTRRTVRAHGGAQELSSEETHGE